MIWTSIIELVNIDECLHEDSIVIFITKKDFKKTENNYITEDDDENSFKFYYHKKVYIMILIDSWSHCGEQNSYINNEKSQVCDIEMMNSAHGSSGSTSTNPILYIY